MRFGMPRAVLPPRRRCGLPPAQYEWVWLRPNPSETGRCFWKTCQIIGGATAAPREAAAEMQNQGHCHVSRNGLCIRWQTPTQK